MTNEESKQATAQSQMLASIVRNALYFLNRSILDLKEAPKISVVSFHTAIELFLKARLLAEHWTLVVSSKGGLCDLKKFSSGEFQSVTLKEAADRLDAIVQSGLSKKELAAFTAVTNHRNRMVHFFHEAEEAENAQHRVQGIVKEQLHAWYLLHELLLKRWNTVFAPWWGEITAVDKLLRGNHSFLRVVYEEKRSQIAGDRARGALFDECPACAFEAERHVGDEGEPYETECLVCGFTETCIKAECPECGELLIVFRAGIESHCSSCSGTFGGKTLIEIFVNSNAAYLAAKDGDFYPFPVNCGACIGYEKVVQLPSSDTFCTDCFDVSTGVDQCEYCSDYGTHMSDDSYLDGCGFCEGRAGRESD